MTTMNFQYSNILLFFQIPVTHPSTNSTLPGEKGSEEHLGQEVETTPTTSNNLDEWDSNAEGTTPEKTNPSNPSLPTEEKDLGGIGWKVVRSTTPISLEEWDFDEILTNLNCLN